MYYHICDKCVPLFSEEKILSNVPYKDKNKEILVKLLWQIFKFFKYKYVQNISVFINIFN